MTEIPGTEWTSRRDGDTSVDAHPFPAPWEPCGTVSHVFTHFELRLSVFRASVVRASEGGAGAGAAPAGTSGWWEPLDSLKAQALPTVMKKAIAKAIPHAFAAG
ncbi:A/G-specific adenine glycosylase, partial [Sinorhizobium medicae]